MVNYHRLKGAFRYDLIALFYFMEISRFDSDVEQLLCDLVFNNYTCPLKSYEDIEIRYPQYFNKKGFIPLNDRLNKILWMPDVKGYCAYILYLEDGRTYKGYTSQFRTRMIAHFDGRGCVTTSRTKPLYILHYESFGLMQEALVREQQFKRLSGLDKIRSRLGELRTIYPPQYKP